uniref:Uncharacterized protein n=1 Tax=Arundo donax TaxID=35708 RepID=A0A0A9G9Z9_ARUDO
MVYTISINIVPMHQPELPTYKITRVTQHTSWGGILTRIQ